MQAKEDLSAQARARDRAAAVPASASRADGGASASTSVTGGQPSLPSKLAWSGPLPSAVQKREIIGQDP
ncbi:hypothetical protein DUNSADRAFT_925 [Dunaliella salina]|uniref:Encoded protein n=1 Tax=Dunaliella salina TaxID=3046 RepID=A0ABQ7H8R6_DUNSA|nr:hypothetical protein DUNSADRAFT_925 [Dunaliella salina]|eukprot:KAF5843249.1 hypothetical protein DUNSADRAFT_925 [Dunaliella salina]